MHSVKLADKYRALTLSSNERHRSGAFRGLGSLSRMVQVIAVLAAMALLALLRSRAVGALALTAAAVFAVVLAAGVSPARASDGYDAWFETESAQSRYAGLLDAQNAAEWEAEQAELSGGSSAAEEVATYLADLAADAGAEESIGAGLAEATMVGVPPATVTVAATAVIAVGGYYFYKKFFGNVGSSNDAAQNVETFRWQFANPCGGADWTPSAPVGACWNLRTTSYTYWCVAGQSPGCDSARPPYLTVDADAIAGNAGVPVTQATSWSKLSPFSVERFWTPDLGEGFTGVTGWQPNGQSPSCPGAPNICITYPPLSVPTTGTPATTTEVEVAPDIVKFWIYHTIIHSDPQPGDPADPGNPVTDPNWERPLCELRAEHPHESDGTPGAVDAKVSARCNVAPVNVPVTTTLWKCDEEPIGDLVALEEHTWGCDKVAQETGDILVEQPRKYFGPVQAPRVGTPNPIPPDNKWFIALGESPVTTPSKQWSAALQIP